MSKYAIIKLQGKQHRVEIGQKLTVDRLEPAEGKEFKIAEVLFVSDGKTSQVGTPLVEKASVTVKVLEHLRGDKIRVAKFKAKSRYRRVIGHRQLQSAIEITKITA